ncbi:protein NRT1/ PTR FAMILY 8.3-like isoform X2 [Phragmites australis]|nr:protein NRT1/ PTR FAMILY 8.3-like isoform X2 [Phragmites australis]XP_062206076.1 protein NRT1/ PTR FAMILY 8.3-like isoform X2 [Phragmites australis]XP_062206077.1 protein NRT1/ PTR FAMILY 8.3-like isoform X2 [Phragmites australis]XP_062206078.1 protein NRT1/ PTR FAMILY 8.3-like isoform X2 [Phragmites australis]
MSPPPGSNGHHQHMESGGDASWKRFTWKAPAIVLVFELLESIAFSGVALNLVVYLGTVLHGSTAFNAAHVDTWNGTTFIVPVIGAFLADSYWGKYKTILASIAFYLIGLVLLTVSAAIPSLRPATACQMGMSCPPATKTQFSVFFAALYLTSIGTGGVKSALLPFGAEQYDDDDTDHPERKQSFFSWFFAAINLGIFIAGTLISWLEQNVAWALGFGVGTGCLLVAAVAFVVGTPWYRVQLPTGSPLKDILRVLVASLRKRNLRLLQDDGAAASDSVVLHELDKSSSGGQQRLARTKGLRCLDKAAVVVDDDGRQEEEGAWSLCTVTEVEGVKILVRMLPIWATCVLYAASLGQMTTTFIQQGMAMDTRLGGRFKVPVASLVSVEVVFMLLWVLLHDAAIIPVARRVTGRPGGLTQLQRMGVGRFLVVLALATAALVERRRLRAIHQGSGDGETLSIVWQVPQFVLVAGSDVFCGIAQLEFFYGEAPAAMRSICSAFSFLALSLGFYVNSLVVTLVAAVTGRPGWLAPDLNEGHLDYYFWLWTVISVVSLLLYMVLAARYTPKQVAAVDSHPTPPASSSDE